MPVQANRVLCPSRSARLAARLRGPSLDRALIGGADPAASPQLAARAGQLTARSTRAEIADGLERLLVLARSPGSCRRGVVPRRGAITSNAGDLGELAALLRSSTPLYAQGIAILRELLVDGTGPAYCGPGDGDALAQRLQDVRAAL